MSKDESQTQSTWTRAVTMASLGFTLVMFIGAAVVGVAALKPVSRIEVTGNMRVLDAKQIAQRVKDVPKQNYFLVDVDTMQVLLEQLPWVKAATITRVWPDAVRIKISEHKPVARWKDDGLLSQQGLIFAPPVSDAFEGLPRVIAEEALAEKVALNIQRFRARLASLDLVLQTVQIDQRGVWTLRLADGPKLILGRHDIGQRLERFLFAFPKIKQVQNVASVDLRYNNGIAVRWKKKKLGNRG